MLIVVARTLVLYFSLILFLRIMGKRQVGELDISELVSALLLSEIVAMPIENTDIPLAAAIIPMLIIISLEVLLSFAVTRSDIFKCLLSSKPSILIRQGQLDISELSRSRMSVEELLSELRLNGIGEISDVNYATLEQNGQISVIIKKSASPVSLEDMEISAPDRGISHPLIVDGHIKKEVVSSLGLDTKWVNNALEERGLEISDVFLMAINDAKDITIIKKGRT